MKKQNLPGKDMSNQNSQRIENIYHELLASIMVLSYYTDKNNLRATMIELIDLIIQELDSDNELFLTINNHRSDEDYIFAHSLNVCLISVRLALRLGFDRERVRNLGYLAITHARKDMGYPEDLSDEIRPDNEMDEIIRLADVYDAITHPPSYRNAMLPVTTLTEIVHSDSLFDQQLIKLLIKEISFFPKGSWVQLSSREIGKVVGVNKGSSMHPLIEIHIDQKGNYLKEKKVIDLSKNRFIHVTMPLTVEEIDKLTYS
ncbi:MAG: HD-GYP domain-containing protein [bacterium]